VSDTLTRECGCSARVAGRRGGAGLAGCAAPGVGCWLDVAGWRQGAARRLSSGTSAHAWQAGLLDRCRRAWSCGSSRFGYRRPAPSGSDRARVHRRGVPRARRGGRRRLHQVADQVDTVAPLRRSGPAVLRPAVLADRRRRRRERGRYPISIVIVSFGLTHGRVDDSSRDARR
jgi:hypothetical protein